MVEDTQCGSKAVRAIGSSGAVGALVGSVSAAWSNPVEATGGKKLPQMQGTLKHVASHAGLFAILGGIFAATDCLAETARETKDWKNGAIAGCVTGLAIGARAGSAGTGLGACAAIASALTIAEFAQDNRLAPPLRPQKLAALPGLENHDKA